MDRRRLIGGGAVFDAPVRLRHSLNSVEPKKGNLRSGRLVAGGPNCVATGGIDSNDNDGGDTGSAGGGGDMDGSSNG